MSNNQRHWELICRINCSKVVAQLSCQDSDLLVELITLNKVISVLNMTDTRISFFLYRRSSWSKFGNLFTTEQLAVGRFTNDSHGITGKIRKRGLDTDYYLSVFVLVQRFFISRKRLLKKSIGDIQRILMEGSYWKEKRIVKASTGSICELTVIENASIQFRNVVLNTESYFLTDGSVGPTNWQSDVYTIDSENVLVRTYSLDSKVVNEIQNAVYIGSRKDYFYYHALHWTLLKYLSLDNSHNGIPFIVESNLNTTVKNFILDDMKERFPRSVLIELAPNEIFNIKRLALCMQGSGYFSVAHASQISKTFKRAVRAELGDSEQKGWDKRTILICFRKENLILSRPVLANWDEVISVLALTHHVVTIDPSVLTLQEQAIHFANCDVVLSEHGGALANMIFMQDKASVIELELSLSDPLYKNMADALKLNYKCVTVPSANGYSVDIDAIQKSLLDV